jgi:hypothetical protein
MFLFFSILIGAWLLYMGWKFYRRMDWTEPADPSPDLKGMHKREAELLHIQDVLEEARAQGKLSSHVVEEFNRYAEAEIEAQRKAETAWKNRHVRHSRESGKPE